VSTVQVVNVRRRAKVHDYRSNHCWDMAISRSLKTAAVRHLRFFLNVGLNFDHVHIRLKRVKWVIIPN